MTTTLQDRIAALPVWSLGDLRRIERDDDGITPSPVVIVDGARTYWCGRWVDAGSPRGDERAIVVSMTSSACPVCSATEGNPCTQPSGVFARVVHAARAKRAHDDAIKKAIANI